jgi:hypothetical protein
VHAKEESTSERCRSKSIGTARKRKNPKAFTWSGLSSPLSRLSRRESKRNQTRRTAISCPVVFPAREILDRSRQSSFRLSRKNDTPSVQWRRTQINRQARAIQFRNKRRLFETDNGSRKRTETSRPFLLLLGGGTATSGPTKDASFVQ